MNDDSIPRESLALGEIIGKGGEATVCALRNDPNTLAKLYHHPSAEKAAKLRVMIANPPSDLTSRARITIAWPRRRVFDRQDPAKVRGFLMPRVIGGIPLAQIHNMKSRLQTLPSFHWKYLVRCATNLSREVSRIHCAGYVIGDANDTGVLVANDATVSLVDCDSFQVKDLNGDKVYRCTVGVDLFTPPELLGCRFSDVDRNLNHDAFGLAVLIFLTLIGSHPFSVKTASGSEQPTIGNAIRDGLYPDNTARASTPPFAPPLSILPPEIRALFRTAFAAQGKRRPSANDWIAALQQLDSSLTQCRRNQNHHFSSHLSDCPWCERARSLGGRDPFPSPDVIARKDHLKPIGKRHRSGRSNERSAPPTATTRNVQPVQPTASLRQHATTSLPAPTLRSRVNYVVPRTAVAAVFGLFLAGGLGAPVSTSLLVGLVVGAVAAAWFHYRDRHSSSSSVASGPGTVAGNYNRRPITPRTIHPPTVPKRIWSRLFPGSSNAALVASTRSKKYHREQCERAQKIRSHNRIVLSDTAHARRMGLVPCGACNPPK